MAWEDRNGRQYYYRKHRIGRYVFSEYIGSGPVAELCAALDEAKRKEKEQEQKAWQKEKEDMMAIDRQLDNLIDTTRVLTRASLLLSGFYPHKYQWRKKLASK